MMKSMLMILYLALTVHTMGGTFQSEVDGDGNLILVVDAGEIVQINGLELAPEESRRIVKLSPAGEILWQTEISHCPGASLELTVDETGMIFLHGSSLDEVNGDACFFLISLRPDGVTANVVQGSKPVGT